MTVTSLRVLLVDDEALALERLEALFDDIDGTEVVGTALDGREALEKIEALTPDLVMLDIQMPGKSGLRVAADLPAEKRPEIVFATAFERYAPDAFDVEAADYLLKPVRFDRLRQAVERAKRRKAMREALGSSVTPNEGYTSGWVWSYPLKAVERSPALPSLPMRKIFTWFIPPFSETHACGAVISMTPFFVVPIL